METLKNIWGKIVLFFSTTGWTIVTFLAALTIGILVIRILIGLIKRALLKSPIDNSLCGFISTILSALLWLTLIFILGNIASIPLTPLITALGAVVLAIGLALKDSLSNLANGVVLIGTKPFKVGDFVDIEGIAGTVKAIKMMTTEIVTPDNKKITVPNSKITSSCVINFSAKPTRRVDWTFSVSYNSDIDKVKATINEVLSAHSKVLSSPDFIIRLDAQNTSSLDFCVKAWTASGDYWTVKWDINELVLSAFRKNGIEIPFNQLDVHIRESSIAETTMDNSFTVNKEKTLLLSENNKINKKGDK